LRNNNFILHTQADETVIVSRDTTAHLLAHECTRVFHDRLTDQQDRDTFYEFLSDDLHNYFKVERTGTVYVSNERNSFMCIF